MPECVYGCRHPLWGGAGTCLQRADPTDYECSCDDGFRSTDSFGSPSCVSKRALAALHISVAVCGVVASGYLLLTAMKQRHLSTAAQASRRAVLRLRLIRSASVYCGSASIVFWVAAAHGTVYEVGMLQTLYSLSMPAMAMAVAHMIDLWIDSLPKQFIPADSIALKVIKLAEEKNICMWVGRVALVSLAPFGLMTFFVLDTIKVVRAINLMTGTAGVISVLCFNFVGFHLTGVINGARRQASPSAMGFYRHVLRTLWLQVAALSFAATLWIAMGVALEPQLTGVGARTPIIPISIMVLDGFVGNSLVVYFAKIRPNRAPSSRPTIAIAPLLKVGVRGGLMAHMPDAAIKLKETFADSSAPNNASFATTAGKRVIPSAGAC